MNAGEIWAKAQRACAELSGSEGARVCAGAALPRQAVAEFAVLSGGQFLEQLFVVGAHRGDPLVIWRVEAVCCGVAVSAQGSRPATREDLGLEVVLCGDEEAAGAELSALKSKWSDASMGGEGMMPIGES